MGTTHRRWRLDLGYDGTDFSGWAVQPDRRTVQGELEHWLPRVLRLDEPVRLVVAGRTDAGVHARAQVAHFDLPVGVDSTALLRRLRRVLSDAIVVHALTPAPDGFDARFSAIWRRYVYRLWDSASTPDPLFRHMVTLIPEELDLGRFNAAGNQLLGLRDFAPFCKPRQGATTIRTLLQLHAQRTEDLPGTIECTLVADAFCHSMVRSVMGALVAVGAGRRDDNWFRQVMTAELRHNEVLVMPAKGLTLEEVGYPDEDHLARRAAEARSKRESTTPGTGNE